jgi:hypothetical protein
MDLTAGTQSVFFCKKRSPFMNCAGRELKLNLNTWNGDILAETAALP